MWLFSATGFSNEFEVNSAQPQLGSGYETENCSNGNHGTSMGGGLVYLGFSDWCVYRIYINKWITLYTVATEWQTVL